MFKLQHSATQDLGIHQHHFKMKKLYFIVFITTLFSCSSGNNSKDGSSNIAANFINDISSLENLGDKNPIPMFQESAENTADKVMDVSKDNIAALLKLANEYDHCVITTGDHTIVKIESLSDCSQSGSWGVCMPMVKGYIRKGELVYQEDYMNNIIGLPNEQTRRAFLFK